MADQDEKTAGRPRKGDGDAFPVDEVDRLLVHGEPTETTDGELEGVRYPSYRELAERYGVAHSLIARYSKQHSCMARRHQARKRVKELSDEKLIELRADTVAFSRDDQITTIDQYLAKFSEAVKEGRTRVDNPADFNTMCRLRAFLVGEAESRHEVQSGMPTLEDLQQRYREMMDTWELSTPEEREALPEHLYGFDGAARQRKERGRGSERVDDDDVIEAEIEVVADDDGAGDVEGSGG